MGRANVVDSPDATGTPSMRPGLVLALLLLTSAAEAGGPVCGAAYDPAEKISSRPAAARLAPPDLAGLPAPVPVDPALRGSIRRVDLPEGQKLVALTFDLCEVPGQQSGYDGGVVEVLRREGVAATFFVGGHWAATHPTRFSELAHTPGFTIANHSWSHQNDRVLGPDRLMSEIRAPLVTFRREAEAPVCPASTSFQPTRLYRFPFGACSPASMAAVNDAGMLAIQWDVSTGDPSPGQSAGAIVAQTLAQVRPGSIVLAHANGRGWHTAEALPRLISELRKRGYSFVTVDDLLTRGKPVIAPTCYDGRPGDTNQYDHFFGGGVSARTRLSR